MRRRHSCHWIVAASLFLLVPGARVKSAAAAAEPPRPAPAFQLATRDSAVSLQSLRGKVVVVDFWASWCEPCRRSFPWLASLQKRYGSQGLAVVAINLDKNRQAAEKFLQEVNAPFTVAFDPGGEVADLFHVEAMPSSFVVGRDGALLYRHAGFDPGKSEAFEARVEEALKP